MASHRYHDDLMMAHVNNMTLARGAPTAPVLRMAEQMSRKVAPSCDGKFMKFQFLFV